VAKYFWCFVAAVVLCGVLLTTPSLAAEDSGFYLSVLSGANFLDYARTSARTRGTSIYGHTSFDVGWLAGLSAGYEWPIGLALEEEFTFRTNNLDKLSNIKIANTSLQSAALGLEGSERSYDIMTNLYYRLHNSTPFTPYVAGGIGEAVLQPEGATAPGLRVGSFGAVDADFGYQGIGGVSYSFSKQVTVGIEYRYFGTATRPVFENSVSGVGNVKAHGGYHANDGLIRLSYYFK
jgi:opacity protein-like surface antigen